jgi:hypothetical protein
MVAQASHGAASRVTGWGRFSSQTGQDLRLWLFVLAYLWLFRWFMNFIFRCELGSDIQWLSLIRCSVTGFRFDVSVATYWVLLPMFISVLCAFTDSTRLADRVRLAGAHIDLVPTLVELCAPAGFEYSSFGGNLLDPMRPRSVSASEPSRVLILSSRWTTWTRWILSPVPCPRPQRSRRRP